MDKSKIIDGQTNDFGTELSHIDKRLQEVLGHCRKYFGEVPLSNCRSVSFGKYGSFLPDCQHSPCNSPSQDRSQHVLSYNLSKLAQTVPLDNASVTSCGDVKPLPSKNGPDSTTIASRSEGNSARHDMSAKGSVACASDQSNLPMPKIKLNGETVPMNKRIHQSLGLDMSSSSSEGDSPICERRFTGSAGGATPSPNCISQSMTIPPIIEDVFLSPLPDTLMSLVETPREVDGRSCESISRNSNPLTGGVISCLYEMLTKSSRDICDSFDSVEKRVVGYPVSPNSPAKHISPDSRGVSTSLTKMENWTDKDPMYRSVCETTEMIIQNDILQDSDDPISYNNKIKRKKVSAISKDENDVSAAETSPLRSAASCLMREAHDLKLCANDLKSSGLRLESTEIYFQAALKYLDAASLLETHVSESTENVALTPSKIYDTTAKLLEYCAQEYESYKDMACAALAYKCLEASNMQIVYSTDDNARRDYQELQASLQSLTSVTNASDEFTKNRNSMETIDMPNGFTSSQLTESYPLDSRSRSMFAQLLNFAECANSAMKASRKAQISFGYASSILQETGSTEVVECIKRALNHGFYDMKKLLHLVHEAMEALSS